VVAHVGCSEWRNRIGRGGGFEPESLEPLVRNRSERVFESEGGTNVAVLALRHELEDDDH
jgi:hypothetical protein